MYFVRKKYNEGLKKRRSLCLGRVVYNEVNVKDETGLTPNKN